MNSSADILSAQLMARAGAARVVWRKVLRGIVSKLRVLRVLWDCESCVHKTNMREDDVYRGILGYMRANVVTCGE